MHRLVQGLLVLALLAPAARAADEAKKESKEFAALKKEFESAQKKFTEEMQEPIKAVRAAKTPEEREKALEKYQELLKNNPAPKFAAKFYTFAKENPKDASAFDALYLALRNSGAASAKDGLRDKVLAGLSEHHVKNERMGRLVRTLTNSPDGASEKLLRTVIKENPNRKVQARAYKALAGQREFAAQVAQQIKGNERLQKSFEQRYGKKEAERLAALDPDKARAEAEELNKVVKEKYSDIFPDLSIGQKAPEVVIENLKGQKEKLSGLRGKVVVLDIWATWCPPCRAMIPHEREMVKRLKDKPFTLVSISADAKKETLTDFIAENPMPWTHWWNGNEGGILETWDVQYFPTIYVLDHKGVIRHKDIRGEKLEEAVNKLLEEMEKEKSSK